MQALNPASARLVSRFDHAPMAVIRLPPIPLSGLELTPDAVRFMRLFSKLARMAQGHMRPNIGRTLTEALIHHRKALAGEGEPFTTHRILDSFAGPTTNEQGPLPA